MGPEEGTDDAVRPNGLFVQVKRAVSFFGGDVRAARQACLKAVLALSARDFAETISQTWDVCDVYAVKMDDGSGWYLKLTIDETLPEVAVISFHPLERPIRTNRGMVKP